MDTTIIKPRAYRVLSREYIRKLASLLAGREKVTVVPDGCWKINLKDKVLHYDENSLRRFTEDHVLGFLLHEIGHLNYTTQVDTDTELFKKHPTISADYINAFEDIRIDSLMSYKYRGSMEIIEAMHEQATAYALDALSKRVDKSLELHKKLGVFEADSKNSSLPDAVKEEAKKAVKLGEEFLQMNQVQMIAFACLATYYRNMNAVYRTKATNALPTKLHPYVDAVLAEMETANLEWLDDTLEVQDFWEKRVYPIIKDLIPPEESKESKAMHEGQGAASTSGQGGQGKQDLNAINQSKARARAQKDQNGGNGTRTPASPGDADGDGTRASKAQKAIPEQNPDSEALSAPSVGHENGGEEGNWYDHAREGARGYVSNLTARLGRILRDNSFDRFGGRHRSGHIKKRGLYKFLTNETRLFERKTELEHKSYAVSIVIDASGSMDGKRWDESLKATAMLVDTLKKMNIPSEVTVFSQGHVIAKAFHQPIVPVLFDEKISEVKGGGTNLFPAMYDATRSLARRQETEKFLIVLTDGGVDSRDQREVPQLIQKHKNIKFYGIGIETGDEIGKVIPASINITDASQVPVEFARILKSHIKRH